MQAVALQNLSMMMSVMGGIFLGGAIMQIGGTAAGFWLITVSSTLGWLLSARKWTARTASPAPPPKAGSIRDGARVALGTEPLRSLLAVTVVFGMAITASTLLLPEFARDVLDKDSLAASALNVAMSVGMMITSMVLAARWRPSQPGPGDVDLRRRVPRRWFDRDRPVAGVPRDRPVLLRLGYSRPALGMTLMRTLTQSQTPPELMGRVMGLSMMAQNGAFPVAAVGLFALVAATDVADAMVITGIVCTGAHRDPPTRCSPPRPPHHRGRRDGGCGRHIRRRGLTRYGMSSTLPVVRRPSSARWASAASASGEPSLRPAPSI